MLDVVLIRGLPGSGKTTLAHKLVNSSPTTVYHAEADSFFMDVNNAGTGLVYKFDRRMLGAAHDYCYGSSLKALYEGVPVIVSNTFTTRREVDRYIEGMKRSGLPIRVYIIKCVGEFESVHGVPKSAIKRMKDRWEDYPGEVEYNVNADVS